VKRDMDLIRGILLEVEAAEPGKFIRYPECGKGHPQRVVAEHMELLADEGLVEANITHLGAGPVCIIKRLTMAGHDWLDVARDPILWNRAKQQITESKLESVSLEVMKNVLTALAQQAISGGLLA
ncbi:MAG: DUF2513 domain-containing protein, partial [Rhodospirillales bacterium]|nr:DUF2513 domain-containing protein [Rhodospirillales bacterium]